MWIGSTDTFWHSQYVICLKVLSSWMTHTDMENVQAKLIIEAICSLVLPSIRVMESIKVIYILERQWHITFLRNY